MKNKYYFLLLIIALFVTLGVYVLIDRASQADAFFEYQKMQESLR